MAYDELTIEEVRRKIRIICWTSLSTEEIRERVQRGLRCPEMPIIIREFGTLPPVWGPNIVRMAQHGNVLWNGAIITVIVTTPDGTSIFI